MTKTISLSPDNVRHYQHIELDDDITYNLVHRSPGVGWMVTPGAQAFWYNQSFYDFTGKTPDFMKNWAWQDFVPPEEIPEVATSFYAALDHGIAWKRFYHFKIADGTFRPLIVEAVPIRNGKGDVKYWLGNATDLSDLGPVKLRKILKSTK